jgi:5-methylcytosine-specific restriction enzyme A
MTILRLCNDCGRTYEHHGRSPGRCPECKLRYEREKSRRRRANSAATRIRDSAAWQHTRAQARARDRGCVYRHEGACSGRLEVHHIVPLEQGGTNQLDNLVTVCRAHHEKAEARFFEQREPPSIPKNGERVSELRESLARESARGRALASLATKATAAL